MRKVSLRFTVFVILLLVLFPIAAGCLSVPGPESAKKTTPVTAAVTRSPQATAGPTAQSTGTQAPVLTTAPVRSTLSAVAATPQKDGYAVATCADQGGFLVIPGETCSGTWLPATNTFSCCSVKPVKAAAANRTVSVAPFTMTVNIEDSLASLTP